MRQVVGFNQADQLACVASVSCVPVLVQLVGNARVGSVTKQVAVTTVGVQEVTVVFNGFVVVVVSTELSGNVNALAVVNFPGLHRDVVPVVSPLNPKEVVGLGGQSRSPPATFEDGLGNGDGRQHLVLVPTFDGPNGNTFDE